MFLHLETKAPNPEESAQRKKKTAIRSSQKFNFSQTLGQHPKNLFKIPGGLGFSFIQITNASWVWRIYNIVDTIFITFFKIDVSR